MKFSLRALVLTGFCVFVMSLCPTQAMSASVTAVSAYTFMQSIGVNTHLWQNWVGTAYTDSNLIEAELKYLGITRARDCFNDPTTIAIQRRLYQNIGLKYDIWIRGATYFTEIGYVKANADMVGQVEGANEPDNFYTTFNGLTGIPAAVAEQRQLYSDIKSYGPTSGLTVNSLTLINPANTGAVGNISAYTDVASAHIYPQWGGDAGGWVYPYLQYALAQFGAIAPGKPYIITEGGYWTQPHPTGVPESVHAKYTLNYLFDAYKLGLRRVYLYELVDTFPDPLGLDMESHFGLFRFDGTAKPAAVALHNVSTILADTKSPTTLNALNYTMTGLPATGYSLLMQKSDGTLVLAIWNDAKIWDNIALRTISVPDANVLLDLGQTVKDVKVYDPILGLTPTKSLQNVAGFTLPIPDHPILVVITPNSMPNAALAPTNYQTTVYQSTPATTSVKAGQSFNLTYNWYGAPMNGSYKVFVHFINSLGAVVFTDDHYPPVNTLNWTGPVSYTRTIPVPAYVLPSTYRIDIGIFNPSASYSSQPLAMGASVSRLSNYHYQTGIVNVLPPL